ncbi:MAG: V-type ATPase subunit [Candidatus Micrarchaeaceae archaeon]
MKPKEYGYANARIKAMESMLLNESTMQKLRKAKNSEELISILYDTAYKQDLVAFGGLGIKDSLLDFAISRNLSKSLEKLVRITPDKHRSIMRSLLSKWDFANIKLAIEAKARGMPYGAVANYIVDRGPFNAAIIKESLEKEDVRSLLGFLSAKAPAVYRLPITKAAQAYETGMSAFAAIDAIDMGAYELVGAAARALFAKDGKAARMARMTIDIQNAITLVRAKAAGASFGSLAKRLLKGGSIGADAFADAYAKSNNVDELAAALNRLGLGSIAEAYERTRSLTQLELGMRKHMLEKSKASLAEVLSFSALLAYAYVKELEIINLRVLIKSKQYGLGEPELSMLVV